MVTEKLCDGSEIVKRLCSLYGRLNTSGGSKAAMTARIKIGWVKFRKCRKVLYGKRSSRLKGKNHQCCVQSAMLYGSETWCLNQGRREGGLGGTFGTGPGISLGARNF